MINKEELLNLLQQHSDIQQEIKKLEKRLDMFKKRTIMVSDVVQNGYKRHAVIHGVDIFRKENIDKLEDVLCKRYNQLLEYQTQIEKVLNDLSSDLRQIIEHRYIDNMNWIQIQLAMGYEHEDKARKKHDRFFEKK